MNRTVLRSGLLGFLCLGLAILVWAQTRSQTSPRSTNPTPMAEPTNVSGSAMTPGSGSLTPRYQTSPSGTPGYGSNLYGIPPTTPQGMPTYSTTAPAPTPGMATTATLETGGMGAAAQPRPMAISDCRNGGWRGFAALRFKSQKGCEAWLKKHPAGAGQGVGTPTMPTTPGRARMLATPQMRTTPGMETSPATSGPTYARTPRMRTSPGLMTPGYSGTPGSSITPFRDVTPGASAH